MNNKELQIIEAKIAKVENKLAIAEAKQDGLVLEISEKQKGRFRIMRDYTKKTASNKKLKKLMRD